MSLIDLLNEETVWQDFLEHKRQRAHLPIKVIQQYGKFVADSAYLELADQIRHGYYHFSIPRKVVISKMGKSKKRVVYLYNEQETYILKLLSFLLYRYDYLFADNLYSFRQKSGVKKAIEHLTRNHDLTNLYGYKVDIRNYFNSIDVEILLKNLERELSDLKLYQLFEELLRNKKVIYQGEIVEEEKGVMAGNPLSAFLANYYLKEMDHHFQNEKVLYARYADDIIVFDKDYEQILKHRQYIVEYLDSLHLEVNQEKEFFYRPGDSFEFLGFSYLNGVLDLSDNTIRKMKGKIRRAARGLRRWKLKKGADDRVTLKAMNRKFNRKFFGKNEADLSWKYWFFPTITTVVGLKTIDRYMQEWQRYIVTGKHNKKNFKKVPYDFLKECNYRSLVNEFYKEKKK